VLGQAENVHRALLEFLLAGTGLTYQRWVGLTLVAVSGQARESDIIERLIGALKMSREDARVVIADLARAGLVNSDDGHLGITDGGRTLYDRTKAAVDEIVSAVYSGIPAGDPAVTDGPRLAMSSTRQTSSEI
jgi:hypothetical protein